MIKKSSKAYPMFTVSRQRIELPDNLLSIFCLFDRLLKPFLIRFTVSHYGNFPSIRTFTALPF